MLHVRSQLLLSFVVDCGCRWKQELETIRKECTVLLRERYMLEQCVRYLPLLLAFMHVLSLPSHFWGLMHAVFMPITSASFTATICISCLCRMTVLHLLLNFAQVSCCEAGAECGSGKGCFWAA